MKLKLKVNNRVASLCSGAFNMGKKLLGLTVEYGMTLTLVATFAFVSLRLPEAYNVWLRAKVGSRVYIIKDSANTYSGGTGFAVEAPSGASYILTNDHVCGVSKDKQTVWVGDDDENGMRRRIIAHDENSDLCLIEGIPGVDGLNVARSGPSKGEKMSVVGHPKLMPLHVSSGELLGQETVQVVLGPMSAVDPSSGQEIPVDPAAGGIALNECSMPKHKQSIMSMDVMFFVLKVKMCMLEVKESYTTSVEVHPGNSGSPVINFWGNVEAVVFASNSKTNWASMVNLHDIKAFLKNY